MKPDKAVEIHEALRWMLGRVPVLKLVTLIVAAIAFLTWCGVLR